MCYLVTYLPWGGANTTTHSPPIIIVSQSRESPNSKMRTSYSGVSGASSNNKTAIAILTLLDC